MKASEVTALMAILQAAYPNNTIGEATCAVYEAMLSDLDGQEATAAVMRLIATSKWMPTVAEIRAEVRGLKDAQHASIAWGDVMAEIRRVGIYGRPAFDNPITAAAVQTMGWSNLCKATLMAPERARFIEVYTAMLESHGRRRVIEGVSGARTLEGRTVGELVGALLKP